jgi:hypothetical protein
MYPTSPPIVVRAKGFHTPPSFCRPTSGQSYHVDSGYSSAEVQAAPTSFRNVQPQTRPTPQALSPIQDAIRRPTPTRPPANDVPYAYDGRSAAESKLVGEPCLTQQHPPAIVSSGPLVVTPTPSKHAALSRTGWVEHEYDAVVLDHYDQVQADVPDVSRPPAKKRKREEKGVEAGPTKKRKKVDSGQYDAMDGSLVATGGSIFNEQHQGLVPPGVDAPLPSYTLAPPPPWTIPVPSTTGHTMQGQVLESAPSSRLKSASGTGKKERCAVWHVWSTVWNGIALYPTWDGRTLIGFSALDPSRTLRINRVFSKLSEWHLRYQHE